MQNFTLLKKAKIFVNYFLGPLLFVWLSISIYHHILQQPNWEQTWSKIQASVYGEHAWKVITVIVLMLLNWGVEAFKWKVLIQHIQPVSFTTSFKAILSGVSLAMNTPNRVGEYFGRIIYIEEGNRIRAIALTLVGSLSQFIVTIFAGCIGLLFLRHELATSQKLDVGLSLIWINAMIYSSLAGVIFLLLFYFRLSWTIKLLEKIPLVSKYTYFIQKLEEFEWKELLRVLLLSFLRYSVFIIQYVLLLQVFDVNISIGQSIWLTMVMFLALAVVPTIALAELGLRGQLSMHLFGLFSNNTLGIVFTATGIWLINLVIPALAGSLFILGVKLFRRKSP
ncbi:MAG TPA: lysylphosphatidylglycerol synthase domain-containing protein [Segetibacter sp.]